MSSISVTNSPEIAWEPVSETVLELRNGCAELEQSLDQFFSELEAMRQDLVARAESLQQEQGSLRERACELDRQRLEDRQLSEAVQQQAAELAAARDQLEGERRQWERQRATDRDEVADSLRNELDTMRAQFEAQQRQLELVQEQRAELEQRLAVGTAEHVRVKKLEQELADTKCQLQETVAPPVAADVAGEHVVTISQQQLSELQREREALESELELVRNRAAELNETVVEQQRAINEQKTELSTELQQLRRLVEKQADLFADRVEDRKRPASKGREEPSEATAADPVVTSVVAQFAKLQRDVAQRRRQKQ